jgi:2'-5' RNA ligase
MQTQLQQHQAIGFLLAETYEYLLVVNPARDVNEQLAEEGLQFYDTYKEKEAIKTEPQIVVASFFAKEAMEETIIRYMHRIISGHTSFNVMLNNYSGCPPHSIHIRVMQHLLFKQLAAELGIIDQYVRSNGYPAATLVASPHATIARRLPETLFDKAMMDYSRKSFHAYFTVNELVLLKRKSQLDKCQKVNVFRLMPNAADDANAGVFSYTENKHWDMVNRGKFFEC